MEEEKMLYEPSKQRVKTNAHESTRPVNTKETSRKRAVFSASELIII
jgi:hypothetical protein